MKKICVVTGTRSEYGLLYPLLQEIDKTPNLELQLIVTGTHLSPEFGMTVDIIENEGFKISEKIEILLSSDSSVGISKSIGLGNISFAESFQRLKPDMIVLLGDRYEMLAAATAALIARIPISHIHGGETTEGAYDEAIRHSITKMSWLHFASTDTYKNRIIQLGETPSRVFNVGSLGVENIRSMDLMNKQELKESLDIDISKPIYLITFHPVTLEENTSNSQFTELLNALDKKDATLLFTRANADNGGREINKLVDDFLSTHPDNAKAFSSMGQLRYLSAMRHATLVVGNSSSGIIEAPSFGVPSINIGDRQKGRVQAKTTINCEPNQASIEDAIQLAQTEEFVKMAKNISSPYEQDDVSKRILEEIQKSFSQEIILKKQFFDL